MKLSHTDITKRIAEIENLKVKQYDDMPLFIQSAEILIDKKYDGFINMFSRQGKEMCFDLIVKHGITLHYTACPAGTGTIYFANTPSGESSRYCELPSEAVFLAVIKANELTQK